MPIADIPRRSCDSCCGQFLHHPQQRRCPDIPNEMKEFPLLELCGRRSDGFVRDL